MTPVRGRPTLETVSGSANTIGTPTRGWSDHGPSVIPPGRASRASGQVTVFRLFECHRDVRRKIPKSPVLKCVGILRFKQLELNSLFKFREFATFDF